MGKRKEKLPTVKELNDYLIDRYSKWKSIYERGSTDPFWEDGVGLNLVRNHISYYKKKCEEILGDELLSYPDPYFFPLPIPVPYTFMAVERNFSSKGVLPSTKTLCYNEVVKFDWSTAFEEMT